MAKVKIGKRKLIVLCAVALLTSLFIVSVYNYNLGHDRLGWQIGRILFSAFLMLLTIDANRTAKWILIFTFVYSILEFAKNFLSIGLDNWFAWTILVIQIYNLFFIVCLLTSKDISLYFENKQQQQIEVNQEVHID
ncbi:hypothetical protein ACS5PU_10975 [Pedobacter sp. GSP4]|uniref:hypothetical protein n=1 Tax=Pedobacter sp. GSP4 TaxID=3453716 RepID=UPI003EE9AA48